MNGKVFSIKSKKAAGLIYCLVVLCTVNGIHSDAFLGQEVSKVSLSIFFHKEKKIKIQFLQNSNAIMSCKEVTWSD